MVATAACGSVNKAKLDAAPKPADATVDVPPDPADGAKSGTRLKIKWAQYADGTKQFSAWHDAQLNTDCYPQPFYADPTKMYCVPNADSVYYSDAACTTRFSLEYTACNNAHQTYASEYEYTSANCTSGVAHVYSLGAMITTPTNYYSKDLSTGNCNSYGTTPTTNYTSYAVGAEITPTSLVEVTKSAPTAGALGVVSYESADGMSLPVMLHDTTNNFDCNPYYQYFGQSQSICFPNSAAYGGYYQDSNCGTSLAYTQTGCQVPAFTYTYPKTQCQVDTPSVFQLGAVLATQPTTIYSWNAQAQTCNGGTYSGLTYYGIGAATTTQTLTVTPDVFAGRRMQTSQFVSGSTRFRNFVNGDYLYDSTLHSLCYTEQMYDGSFRCFPNAAYVQFFSDSTCTTPLASVYKGSTASCASPTPPTFAYQSSQIGNCYSQDLHQLGAKFTGTTVYQNNGSCTVFTNSAQYDFYEVGPQVPLVGLASATMQIDP